MPETRRSVVKEGDVANSQVYSAASDTMMGYFLSQISVRVTWIEAHRTIKPADTKIIDEIKSGISKLRNSGPAAPTLSEDAAWAEAYQCERLLALLEPPENLLPEIGRRLDEAAVEHVSGEPRLRGALKILEAKSLDTTKTPPALRPDAESQLRLFLMDILEEIHWTLQRKFFARPIMKEAIKKIIWLGLGSFILLLLPFLIIFFLVDYYNDINLEQWPWVALYMALAAGLFGSFFSRLIDIQRNGERMSLGELKNAQQTSTLFLRGAVGMCGALVVFFFLQSGIVSGSLFPNFAEVGFKQVQVDLVPKTEKAGVDEPPVPGEPVPPEPRSPSLLLILPTPSLALLIIWCFLAGFSERLVPTILSSTEGKLTTAAQGTG